MGRISRRRLRRRNRNSIIWVSVIVIMLVGVFSVKSWNLHSQKAVYAAKQEKLEQQIQEEEERARDLEKEAKYRKTKKYVEDYAHNQLGLVYPGEIIFKTQK